MSRIPSLSNKHKLCIICEGNEEYYYLNRLKHLDVFSRRYDFNLDNAKGNGNIPARYQDRYQNGSYELVLVFCDTEKKPHEQYLDIKRKINTFHGIDKVADNVVIFGNPCTLQIICKHWTEEIVTSPSKSINAPMVKKYTGIDNYKARIDQLEEVMESITKENFYKMYQRVKMLEKNDLIPGSSNFGYFLSCFINDDTSWINEINRVLDGSDSF